MPSTRLKTFAAATIVAAALVGSVPAFAAPGDPQQKTVLKYDAKAGKYCVTDPAATGSRISRKTCMTAADWAANGLNMPKPTMIAQK